MVSYPNARFKSVEKELSDFVLWFIVSPTEERLNAQWTWYSEYECEFNLLRNMGNGKCCLTDEAKELLKFYML
jgi:hypothetical protein